MTTGPEDNVTMSTLRVGINLWYPYTTQEKGDNQSVVYTGFCMDLLNLLAQACNFTYRLVVPPDGKWGDLQEGQWTGLVGLLQRKEVDIVVAPIVPRLQALEYYDLTTAFDFPFTGVAVRTVDHSLYLYTAFLSPFAYQVYGVLLCVCLWSLCLVFTVAQWERRLRAGAGPRQSLVVTGLQLFGAVLNEAVDTHGKYGASRALFACWCIMGLVLSSSYTGKLTSLLVNIPAPSPFSSLAEMTSRDDFRWGVMASTMELMELQRSTDPVKQAVYQRLMEFAHDDPEVLSLDTDVHLSRVLMERYAYIGEGGLLQKWARDHCDVTLLPDRVINFDTFHIYTQKNSSHLHQLDTEWV